MNSRLQIFNLCPLFLAALLAFQPAAWAREINGKVVSVDPESGKLVVSTTNSENLVDEEVEILVKPDTAYTGIETFADLEEGDHVDIEASEDSTNGWTASALKVIDESSGDSETGDTFSSEEGPVQ